MNDNNTSISGYILSPHFLRSALTVVIGNLIYAIGVALFILPSGLITGGTTGIAIITNHNFGISISIFVAIFNAVMFVAGFALLGKEFALTTLISTFAYPALLGFLQKLIGPFKLTDDLFLSALFGGLCIGLSLAMIIRIGASTGGMDIPPLVLNKYFRVPVSVSLYVFDFIILIGQMMFSPTRTSLYGIVLVLVYTITLDRLLAIGASKTKLEIVTKSSKEIKKAILQDIDRSVTLLHGQTGYLGRETDIVLTIISSRELYKVERLVHKLDPDAFIILSKVGSVSGRGFSREKRYIDKK